MKTRRNFSVVLTTILAFAAMGTLAWAGSPKPKPAPCTLVGTWSGSADSSDWAYSQLAWTSVVTADSSGTSGEIVLSWVPFSGDMIGSNGHLTAGHGVWQLIGGVYHYTWYTYMIDDNPADSSFGTTIYSIRDFGTVDFPTAGDCNNATMSYTFQAYTGMVSPQDMAENWSFETGTTKYGDLAYETKVPLIVPTTP